MKVCTYICGNAIADLYDFTLYISDSHIEAKNGFGLHTTQVDQRHKTEAFKVSGRSVEFHSQPS